ncbi:MAG: TRAP transporter small permease [Pseudomonadota bacterium]
MVLLFLGGMGTIGCMFLGTGDVVGTQFAGWPIPGAKELTESTMVLIVFGALTYAQIRRGHIRVELVYTNMRPQIQAAMDIITTVAALVFFSLLLWQGIGEAVQSWRIQEADVGLIRFPLYPARTVLVLGTALLVVQLVLDLIGYVQLLMSKEVIASLEVAPTIPKILEQEQEKTD